MRYVISPIILYAFIFLVPISCNKYRLEPRETLPPNPPVTPTKKTPTRVKFLEYGSNIPIQDVDVKSYKCDLLDFGICSNLRQLHSWKSDKDGLIEVTEQQYRDSIFVFDLIRSGYAFPNITLPFGNSFETLADTLFSNTTYDSAVVRLFPNAWIRLHIKDSVGYTNKEIVRSIIDVIRNVPRNNNFPPFLPENQQAGKLDTTLIYKTYGNINNQIFLELLDESKRLIKVVYSGTRFVPKGDTLNWNINF